jgi:hypothetical protein
VVHTEHNHPPEGCKASAAAHLGSSVDPVRNLSTACAAAPLAIRPDDKRPTARCRQKGRGDASAGAVHSCALTAARAHGQSRRVRIDWLSARHGCRSGLGGRFTRAIAKALDAPAVLALLRDTAPGRMLMSKLAGQPAKDRPLTPAALGAVTQALKNARNLAVTMAMVDRLNALEHGGPLSAALAAKTFTSAFIANVPAIVGQ